MSLITKIKSGLKSLALASAMGLACLSFSGKAEANVIPHLNERLVSYYNFEGNTNDSQGTNHGINHGADYVNGKVGEGLYFNGVNDLVEIPEDNSLDLNHLSLSLWFNSDFQTAGHLINKGQSRNEDLSYRLYLVHLDSGTGDHVISGDNWTNENGRKWVDSPYLRNQWNHAAFTYDGDNEVLYLNGKEVDRVAQSGTTRTTDTSLFLGCRLFDSQTITHYEGLMDEVGIWDRALTPVEVGQLWNNGNGPLIPEPTGLVLLAGGAGALALRRRKKNEFNN